MAKAIARLTNSIDNFVYWLNPINWIKEGAKSFYLAVNSGALDIPFLLLTIAAIWLIMLGAEKPKKYLFWSWIGFILLRVVCL